MSKMKMKLPKWNVTIERIVDESSKMTSLAMWVYDILWDVEIKGNEVKAHLLLCDF